MPAIVEYNLDSFFVFVWGKVLLPGSDWVIQQAWSASEVVLCIFVSVFFEP